MPNKEVYVLAYTSTNEEGHTLYWCALSADLPTHERNKDWVWSHGFDILFESLQDIEGPLETEDE